jgi:hypothetical protein
MLALQNNIIKIREEKMINGMLARETYKQSPSKLKD